MPKTSTDNVLISYKNAENIEIGQSSSSHQNKQGKKKEIVNKLLAN